MDTPILVTSNLSLGYGSSALLSGLDLRLDAGELVCLLGPNGSGKSTLLRTLAGLQPALAGQIEIGNQGIGKYSPADLARQLALVLTERMDPGNLRVEELVALGRIPYTGWFGTLSKADHEKIDWAMELAAVTPFRNRRVLQLSDGEKQKVMLARALAQDTRLIILDEPTAHLDLPNRFEMMRLLHTLARQTGKAILLSSHELDLALQTADQLWIVAAEGTLTHGTPEDLVLDKTFEKAFSRPGFHFDRDTGTFGIQRNELGPVVFIEGEAESVFWTKRALERAGFSTVDRVGVDTALKLQVTSTSWRLTSAHEHIVYDSVGALLGGLKTRSKR
jgi:iron complex transport system ATP-binding protein